MMVFALFREELDGADDGVVADGPGDGGVGSGGKSNSLASRPRFAAEWASELDRNV